VQKNSKRVTKEMYPRKTCWGLKEKHRKVAFYNGVELQ